MGYTLGVRNGGATDLTALTWLEQELERLTIAWGRETARGSVEQANLLFDRRSRVLKALRMRGGERTAHARLLRHADPACRLHAASHVCLYDPERGLAVLEKLETDGGVDWQIAFSAGQTARLARSGELSHDWIDHVEPIQVPPDAR